MTTTTTTTFQDKKILFNKYYFPREWGYGRIQSLTFDNGVWIAIYNFDTGSFRNPDITERTFTSEPLPFGRDVFYIEHVIEELYVWLLDDGQWVFSKDRDIAEFYHQDTEHGNYYVVDLDKNGQFLLRKDDMGGVRNPIPSRNYDRDDYEDEEWSEVMAKFSFIKPTQFDQELPPQGDSLGILCCCGSSPWSKGHDMFCDHAGHATEHFTVWYRGCCGDIVRNDLDD